MDATSEPGIVKEETQKYGADGKPIFESWDSLRKRIQGWPEESEIPEGFKVNLGCGTVVLRPSDGWVNADKYDLPGVDITTFDLFRFPWPGLADSSFEYAIASHIVEHIPHEVMETWATYEPDSKVIESTTDRKAELDGFFRFYQEVWRILKHDAIITTIVPYGMSTSAMQDPTHTRYVMPQTFTYLTPVDKDNFDYHLPFKFEWAQPPISYAMRTYDFDGAVLGPSILRCDLRVIKENA